MIAFIKDIGRRIPFLRDLSRSSVTGGGGPFTSSSEYWERRYRQKGNSGAGSYNRLAEFKANFLNAFVSTNNVQSVIEHGCGDGAQLASSRYPAYIGTDISPTIINLCSAKFAHDKTKQFCVSNELPVGTVADLAISQDVIYHLVEDEVFEHYISGLFASADRFVIVYSSDMDQGWPSKHIRHRQFTSWVEKNQPNWALLQKQQNAFPYDPADPDNTSFADFYVYGRLGQ